MNMGLLPMRILICTGTGDRELHIENVTDKNIRLVAEPCMTENSLK